MEPLLCFSWTIGILMPNQIERIVLRNIEYSQWNKVSCYPSRGYKPSGSIGQSVRIYADKSNHLKISYSYIDGAPEEVGAGHTHGILLRPRFYGSSTKNIMEVRLFAIVHSDSEKALDIKVHNIQRKQL